MSHNKENNLVIGGAGFLGAALANALHADGNQVRVFDLHPHPNPAITSLVGDLRDPKAVMLACMGVDSVFQTASLIDWGPRAREKLFAVNVLGNRNVIAACRQAGVRHLVYTSSIDVVFDGHPIAGGDESLPYPKKHLDDYGASKAQAEAEVIAANETGGLRTCALRVAGIYGPGDRTRLPAILQAARNGQMVRLGDGTARFGHVYVTNVVHAHRLAAQALQANQASGQCYFIGDHPPTNFFDFFTPFLQTLGYSPASRTISKRLAWVLAVLSEALGRAGIGPQPPLLTRYVVASTCEDFFFSHAKAGRELGYRPIISYEQALAETIAALRESPALTG